ncbi:tubulin-specific chaperone E [Sinocyclocheilus grahami]|uniref:tubulin-specific chaperone E n=1 Tax=Sinocyclocheilus grahami TaxID=75366 RepID=UPI0007AC870F|nr:PREDICTED: tubulin-specific chaperone E-like [Sinocyclocheilus grahami]
MKAQEASEGAVGRRLSCDGERGTVRYLGPVLPTAGVWLGVEWDDPERGKHDGSHEGVRYFTCRCSSVLHCAPMWQQLEELYLADNHITELLRPERVLQTLQVLDVSSNHIAQETVLEISHLPCLEKLNLSSSSLSVIQFSDASAGNKTAVFPALKTLLLDDDNISEWRVVNELEKLPSLLHLSCRRNPLLQREKNLETARQIIITRLSRLELLDMRQVLSDERRGAELDYCKMFGLDWLKAGGHSDPEKNHPNTEFMSEHPRFLALLQKYGAPDEGELKEQKPFALKNQLLTVTFVCPEDSERKPIEKKLPGSMIVQKVKLPGVELKLSYTCSKMSGREIEIDNDLKPLEFYSVEDGDRILVRWS